MNSNIDLICFIWVYYVSQAILLLFNLFNNFKFFQNHPEVFERPQIEIDETNYFTITEVISRQKMWFSEALTRLWPVHVCFDHNSSWQSHKASPLPLETDPSPRCWCFIEVICATPGAWWSGGRYCLSLPCSLDELLITSPAEVGSTVQENRYVLSRMWQQVSIHAPK